MKILKYQLYFADKQHVQMPSQSRILFAEMQDGYPVIWAEVDESKVSMFRTIIMVGTDREFEAEAYNRYIGTVSYETVDGGTMEWHLFDTGVEA